MLEQATYRRLKTNLTRATNAFYKAHAHQNTDRPEERRARLAAAANLRRAAEAGLTRFEADGYPDSWHSWSIALLDAESAIRRFS